jgi:exonuclease V gamma subunit
VIRLHYSNRADRLVAALADRIAEERSEAGPLASIQVLVPSGAMSAYLKLELRADADEATALAIAQANKDVQRYLEGKTIARVIYKAGKILNLVVK